MGDSSNTHCFFSLPNNNFEKNNSSCLSLADARLPLPEIRQNDSLGPIITIVIFVYRCGRVVSIAQLENYHR